MKKRMKIVSIICILILTTCFIAGCGGNQEAEGEKSGEESEPAKVSHISVSTGSTSGTYYPLGTAIASVINDAKIGVNATAESTGGSVENARLLGQDQTEIIFIETGIADYAYNGEEMFDTKVENIRGLISLYPNAMQVVVKKKSNINSYTDLKGKRVAVGIQGGSTPLNMAIVLEAYEMTMKDIRPEYLGFGQAMDLLKDDQVDAVLVDAGIPNSTIIDVTTQHDVKILPIEPEKVEWIKEKYPFFSDVVYIPKGTYKGVDEDIPTAGSKVMLGVKEGLPEDVVYNITKTIFEQKDEIVKVHKAGESINLEKATDGISIPIHPGAEKYYKEKGVL